MEINKSVDLYASFQKFKSDLDRINELRKQYGDQYALGYLTAAGLKHYRECTIEDHYSKMLTEEHPRLDDETFDPPANDLPNELFSKPGI